MMNGWIGRNKYIAIEGVRTDANKAKIFKLSHPASGGLFSVGLSFTKNQNPINSVKQMNHPGDHTQGNKREDKKCYRINKKRLPTPL